MKRLLAASALTSFLLVPGAFAQTVTDEVDMQLWCGTAMVAFFTNAPPDLSPEEQQEADGYIANGNDLLELAAAAHLEAGFTQAAFDAKKAEYTISVVAEIEGGTATHSFEDCLALVPEDDSGTASDAPSSEPSSESPSGADSSSSSAM